MCSLQIHPCMQVLAKNCWESILGRENGMCKGPEVGGDLAHSGPERRSVMPLQSEMGKEVKFRDKGRMALGLQASA